MSARFTVVRIAGEQELTDQEVLSILERQMVSRGVVGGCTLQISVKATEAQVDKAMEVLMLRVGKFEIARIKAGLPI